jgi:hypothetical protein
MAASLLEVLRTVMERADADASAQQASLVKSELSLTVSQA